MLFMEPFWILMDIVRDAADEEDEMRGDPAYVQCLYCRGFVEKAEVKRRGGCYLCGTPGEEIAKLARQRRGERENRRNNPYRTKCSNCGAVVVAKELREKGCYICGRKPTDVE